MMRQGLESVDKMISYVQEFEKERKDRSSTSTNEIILSPIGRSFILPINYPARKYRRRR